MVLRAVEQLSAKDASLLLAAYEKVEDDLCRTYFSNSITLESPRRHHPAEQAQRIGVASCSFNSPLGLALSYTIMPRAAPCSPSSSMNRSLTLGS